MAVNNALKLLILDNRISKPTLTSIQNTPILSHRCLADIEMITLLQAILMDKAQHSAFPCAFIIVFHLSV